MSSTFEFYFLETFFRSKVSYIIETLLILNESNLPMGKKSFLYELVTEDKDIEEHFHETLEAGRSSP